MITVREATLQDLDTLRRFEKGLIVAERPFDPTIREGPIHYYDLPAMIASPHIHLVLAEQADLPIGSGYARIEPARHYLKHTLHAYLGFMYVDPPYRGKGVNAIVLEALAAWAHSKDIKELVLDVYTKNVTAVRAYEKAGFVNILTAMRRPV